MPEEIEIGHSQSCPQEFKQSGMFPIFHLLIELAFPIIQTDPLLENTDRIILQNHDFPPTAPRHCRIAPRFPQFRHDLMYPPCLLQGSCGILTYLDLQAVSVDSAV
ncbi:hypothetical protein [Photobacterium sp. 53610]|uniref:hypothetical protein n=1 Tax=Photobacterium sp. 53610 TaxID=3102789 RepID=UPI002EDA228A